MSMECLYINLSEAQNRKQFLEKTFQRYAASGWQFTRIAAVDKHSVADKKVQGRLSLAEKACFLSHQKALEHSLEKPGATLILEDDVVFGPNTCQLINAFISTTKNPWDIIFTDICIPDIKVMLDFLLLRKQLTQQKKLTLLNLSRLNFAGASAYIVNGSSKAKLLSLLSNQSLDIPYDLLLRKWIVEKKINALVIFPFVTSLSGFADSSQIQPNATQISDNVWNAFRRLMWFDRDCAQACHNLETIAADFYDEESLAFSKIIATMVSPHLKVK